MSDASGAKGIGAVLVEKDAEGLSFGKNEVHMGLRGVASADMYFDNCIILKDNMVVDAGGFSVQLMEAFDLEKDAAIPTMSLAIAQSGFELCA